MVSTIFFTFLVLSMRHFFSFALVEPITTSNAIVSRRDALIGTATSLIVTSTGTISNAADEEATVDMAAINAARARASTVPTETVDMEKINAVRFQRSLSESSSSSIIPISDPGPLLNINGGREGKSKIKIPRVGYSFYKTPADQAARCTALALRAGVRHLDVGTSYGSNVEIAKALKPYLDIGVSGLQNIIKDEKPEVLEWLDRTNSVGVDHANAVVSAGISGALLSPPPLGSAGRRGRRDALFLSHKISNAEQDLDATKVRRSVKAAIATLGCSYLDMVSIHSPLTDKARRLTTYEALLNLRDAGFVKTVGVCNYGLGPLRDIAASGLDLPAVNQLELSPFNTHEDVVDWCDKYGIAVSCAAWSKLSSADGPTEGWDVVARIAQQKGMTKAQVLVRWALQKGYICVPRSAAASKVERIAIGQNSYGGVNLKDSFLLDEQEISILDGLNVSYKAGKLGRRDGWDDGDVTNPEWDPTDFA